MLFSFPLFCFLLPMRHLPRTSFRFFPTGDGVAKYLVDLVAVFSLVVTGGDGGEVGGDNERFGSWKSGSMGVKKSSRDVLFNLTLISSLIILLTALSRVFSSEFKELSSSSQLFRNRQHIFVF